MGLKVYQDSTLAAVADAVRAKTSRSSLISLGQIPRSVRGIETCSGVEKLPLFVSGEIEEVLRGDMLWSTAVRSYQFYRCTKLISVCLPSTVKSIGSYAFEYCASLERVRVEADTPPTLNSSAFQNCPKLSIISVNPGRATVFKSETNWSEYADIICEEE